MGLISNVVDGFTGSGAAAAASQGGKRLSKAALEGGRLRAKGARQGFDFLNEQLSPFASAFGSEDIASLNALATDPQSQVDFLANNPLFEALKDQSREATFRTQSAGGALGSSGTDEILQNAFLTRGNELINQQINRQFPLFQSAQNASTNLGTQGSSLLQSIKNALAAGEEGSAQALATGQIGAANARAKGVENILGGIGSVSGAGGLAKAFGGLL